MGTELLQLNVLTGQILDSAFRIHSLLGPGLLESVYETLLARDLIALGLKVERQKPVSFEFDGVRFRDAFRVDLLVERSVVVEIKSVTALGPAHHKQLLTYLRLLDCRLGLLLNFGAPHLRDGIKRVAN
ncbi:MAG TPA: GxxExxY protein [Longimicrobiales bacterium]|nr:GxxExxY protein [Longimicrobiales bacterium]